MLTYLRCLMVVVALGLGASLHGAEHWPAQTWEVIAPGQAGMEAARLEEASRYALSGGGSGLVVRGGRIVHAWGDLRQKYDLKSTTKAIGGTALGLALGDGKVRLGDPAIRYHPTLGTPPAENARTNWLGKITLFHLATQTAGFDKPGGYNKVLFEPGTQWNYSDAGPNWLAECITLIYQRDVAELLFERVFTPIGIRREDLAWRNNPYRERQINGIPRREFGSGVSANVDAMARIGLLYLRQGRWQDKRLLPAEFVAMVGKTPPEVAKLPVLVPDTYPGASAHYGLLWWNNNDGTLKSVPRDAYWAWGLGDSLIVVIPSLDLVITRAGKAWDESRGSGYGKLAPFLDPIVASVKDAPAMTRPGPRAAAPYPPSPVIRQITWAHAQTIVRQAPGSDNWPITWADDGHLYTAYGDGRGFEPLAPRKLSLGLARVERPAERFTGINVSSPNLEQPGDGPAGKKASGMLCVDGTLYLLARNAANAQLAWSKDHGQTWTWADWRFETSFGCPTFLNFGRDYAGARDGYVYVYSMDSDAAYTPADRMVLARVPRGRIAEPQAYEFFVRRDESGKAIWSADIRRRGAVFEHAGKCYRSSVVYVPGLKRYLWWQVVPGGDTRLQGGFGIYDAPEPWGPWTTAYFTDRWDVGPGESASFPAKWISEDGKTLWLVFSGDDHFSVRRATVEVLP